MKALRERLDQERAGRSESAKQDYVDRTNRLLDEISEHYDRRPITAEEWADAGNDEVDDLAGQHAVA